jgi:hypothetical protein
MLENIDDYPPTNLLLPRFSLLPLSDLPWMLIVVQESDRQVPRKKRLQFKRQAKQL